MGLMQSIADIKQQLSTIPDPEIPAITIEELGVLVMLVMKRRS